jgi:hypothetical protein
MARKRPLTKTQLRLLAELAASRFGRICVERGHGRGPDGGRIAYGDRDVNAALGLEEAGLLERVSYNREQHYGGRGSCVHHTSITFRRPAAEAEKVFQDQLQAILDSAGKGR